MMIPGAPDPKNSSMEAAIVEIHGPAPLRRITARSSAAIARCGSITRSRYGQYSRMPTVIQSVR